MEQALAAKGLTLAGVVVEQDAGEDAAREEAAKALGEAACAHRVDTKYHTRPAVPVTR